MIQKITLIGLGAMGSFFAPRLQACYGENFRVLANGKRKQRLESEGIWINGEQCFYSIIDSENKEPSDLIIIATKDTGLEQALEDIRNQVSENTIIMAVLNGVESEEKVAAVYGWKHVIYSLMRVSVVMKDYHANYDPQGGKVHFGDKEGQGSGESFVPSPRIAEVVAVFERAGIPYQVEEDVLFSMWWKFMANVGENLTCALLGLPFGAFRYSEDANWIRHAAMKEVAAIANAKGIMLGEKEMESQDYVMTHVEPHNKPSTLQDIENHRKTEIEMFSGMVCRLGQEMGISTPINEMLYHSIRALEDKYLKYDAWELIQEDLD